MSVGCHLLLSRSGSAARRAVLLLCLAMSACASKHDWQAVKPLAPDSLPVERTLQSAPVNPAAWPGEDWWQSYADSQLNDLIGEALKDSPSLQSAQARLRAAQGEVTRASGALLPSTALDAEVTRQRYPTNGLYPPPLGGSYVTDARVAVDFSYDLDFWGRNHQLLQQARADARAVEADKAAARLALTIAVARAYFQLDLQFTLLDISQASLEQQQLVLDLTRQRAAKGLETNARVKQAEATVALARLALVYVQAGIQTLRSQMSDLVGTGPDRGADLQRPHISGPGKTGLPSTLPAELLGRRPDIAAQRWRVEAASHGVTAAEAAFYPNVNLTAFAGLQSIGLSKLLEGGSAVLGVGPALSLPIFNRRALQGALQTQQAQYDLSVAQYNQTLLDAVNDVANVVNNWDSLAREEGEAEAAEDAARNAYTLTNDRYRAGLDNYLTVLSSENQVFLTRALHAELAAKELNVSADLVRALGGGYPPMELTGK